MGNTTLTQKEEVVWPILQSTVVLVTIISGYANLAWTLGLLLTMGCAATSQELNLETRAPTRRPVMIVRWAALVVSASRNALDVLLRGLFKIRLRVFALLPELTLVVVANCVLMASSQKHPLLAVPVVITALFVHPCLTAPSALRIMNGHSTY